MALEQIQTFLGWSTLINMGVMVFSALILLIFRAPLKKFHSTLYGIKGEDLDLIYFRFLAQYKIGILLLNLVPYIALCIVSGK